MSLLKNLKSKLLKSSDIKAKAVRGSFMLGAGAMFQRALRLLSTVILARILAPEDFGLVAIIAMVVMLLESITDAGIRLSVIQNKDGAEPAYINSAWWFQFARGIGLFAVAYVTAPYVAAFYDNAALTSLLRVAYLAILFNGLVCPMVHLLERELRFGKWSVLQQSSTLIGTAVTIGLAYYLENVWAIVIGTVVERLSYTVITYVFCPFLPRVHIDRHSLSELFKFSKGIFGLPLLHLASRQADVFVLGKVVAPTLLGGYYLALKLAELPLYMFTSVFGLVLLPLFSAQKEDHERLKKTLLTVNHQVATVGIPIVLFLGVNSFGLLHLFFGEKYTAASVPLSVLFLNVYARIQVTVLTNIYYCLGLPNLNRRQSIKRFVFLAVFMYPAALYTGVLGAAIIVLAANVLMFLFQLFNFRKLLSLSTATYFGRWAKGVGFGALVLVPNIMLLLLDVDSIILQSALSAAMTLAVVTFGVLRTYKDLTN